MVGHLGHSHQRLFQMEVAGMDEAKRPSLTLHGVERPALPVGMGTSCLPHNVPVIQKAFYSGLCGRRKMGA